MPPSLPFLIFPLSLLPFYPLDSPFHLSLLPSTSVFSLCFFSLYVSYLTPPFPSLPATPTSSSSLQHLYPCGGRVPEKRKPLRQPGTSQMVSKLHLHYPLLFLSSSGQCFTMTRCPCDISHLLVADLPAHKSSTYLVKVSKNVTTILQSCVFKLLVFNRN